MMFADAHRREHSRRPVGANHRIAEQLRTLRQPESAPIVQVGQQDVVSIARQPLADLEHGCLRLRIHLPASAAL
jgi:hypothetical protein